MAKSGAVFSLSVALLGAAMAIFAAIHLGFGSKEEVGPGTFPFLVGIVLAATGWHSGISFIRGVSKNLELAAPISPRGFFKISSTVLTYFCWLLLTPLWGYLPATFIVINILAKIAGLEGWVRPIFLSLSVSFFLYLLFEVLFYVDLPRGLLG